MYAAQKQIALNVYLLTFSSSANDQKPYFELNKRFERILHKEEALQNVLHKGEMEMLAESKISNSREKGILQFLKDTRHN